MATGDQATNLVPLPVQTPAWDSLWASFERSLRAENVRPNTIRTYDEGGRAFRAFLIEHSHPTDPARIDKPAVSHPAPGVRATRRKIAPKPRMSPMTADCAVPSLSILSKVSAAMIE